MKRYIIILFVLLTAFTGCERFDADDRKFDNVVYLSVSQTSPVQLATFSNNRPTYDCALQAALTYPSDTDVQVSLAVDPSLVETYNARYGTSWPMLDGKYYTLSAESVTIPAGRTTSESITLQLRELMGEGDDQTGALPIDATYLVPIRISGASIGVLGGSDVAWYVVKRSSAITVAAQLGAGNWINFPTLDKYGANSSAWNGLTAMTYEALIYIDQFATQDETSTPVSISTIMGVEQYLLLRLGDTNFERQQLQFDGSGSGSQFGKIPGKDATKNLEAGRWYHVACTYDQTTQTVRIYVDGKIQSEETGVGISMPSKKTQINLAMRALYDLWNTASEAEKPQYETDDTGYDKLGDAYQFFIGKSYNEYRPLNGKIAEARVWSVARTPEQIWENMYNVENPADDPSLLGYWKFNEGAGNTVKDYSMYGNDGVAETDIVWPSGIEIPKINETEE
ncbi:MAG TPA: DUF1735 and LamG domain-containing protein [Candidatus Alistipes intestinigallinarum]|uniref:DUF1735 and LamG domain-containing protein n=1 Tax=Candidatus Alistipes intestinigallinarum TaxID=2838440 RepID=A0A9D1Z474_9BACT|nr:DUF1735 and LamG domain-containing protein [Candidatus Alistipes intestinigallinarum]